MKLYDMVELAGRNLREAGLRNSLTTLGIGVGVASLVAMVSLGLGLERLFSKQLGRSGLFDSVFVTARQETRALRPGQPAETGPPKPLDDSARKALGEIPDVVEVYSNFTAVGEFRLEAAKPEDSHFSIIGGLPPSARGSEAFDEFQGQFYSSDNSAEVILLAQFARALLGLPQQPQSADQKLTQEQVNQLLGKNLILRYAERSAGPPPPAAGDPAGSSSDTSAFNVVRREQALKIVGVVTNEPYRGMRQGMTSVLLPVSFAESLNMVQPGDVRSLISPTQGKRYNSLTVRVARSKQVPQVEEQIKKLGFTAFSLMDASRGLALAFKILDTFLGIFGSLALVVASLGIVNTLVMAILERRREIGIMKALGASDGDVKRIFFVEAGTMGVLGGSLGVGMGWLIGRIINFGANQYLQRNLDAKPQDFWYVSLWLVIFAVLFSVLVSLFAGLYPASRAARLDPVQALRHD